MKKIFLLIFSTTTCLSASFSQSIDSLRIIPNPATSNDIVKVVAITSFPGGPCSLMSAYPPTQSGSTITFMPIYCYESGTGGCTSVDTHSIGQFAAGNYILSFQILSTDSGGPCGSISYRLKGITPLNFTVIQGTTGIRSDAASSVKIYPNPVFDFVIFSLTSDEPSGAEIKVLNSSGAIMKHLTLETNPGEQLHGVDLSDLSDGIYFYTIRTKEQLLSGKLVIAD